MAEKDDKPVNQSYRIKCSTCDKMFGDKSSLNLHMKSDHTMNLSSWPGGALKCSKCEKTFTVKKNLTLHMKFVHSKAAAIKCYICEMAFDKDSDLQIHLEKSHKPEKKPRAKPVKVPEVKETGGEAKQIPEPKPPKPNANLAVETPAKPSSDSPPVRKPPVRNPGGSNTLESSPFMVVRVDTAKGTELFAPVPVRKVVPSPSPTAILKNLKPHHAHKKGQKCLACHKEVKKAASSPTPSAVMLQQSVPDSSPDSMLQNLKPRHLHRKGHKCLACQEELKLKYPPKQKSLRSFNHGTVIAEPEEAFLTNVDIPEPEGGFDDNVEMTEDTFEDPVDIDHDIFDDTVETAKPRVDTEVLDDNVVAGDIWVDTINDTVTVTEYEDKSTTCSLCFKVLSTKFAMEKHMLSKHKSEIEVLQCETCFREFLTAKSLAYHIKHVHADPNPNPQCDICQKIFPSSRKLDAHVAKVHRKTYKMRCHLCTKLFVNVVLLRSHLRNFHDVKDDGSDQPLGRKKHQCHICEQKFSTREYMLKHTRDKHNISINKKRPDLDPVPMVAIESINVVKQEIFDDEYLDPLESNNIDIKQEVVQA